MTDKQFQTIVGLLSGMQMTTVHLANTLGRHIGISHEDLAKSFEAAVESIPEDVKSRDVIQLCLRQVAAGIRNTGYSPDFESEISPLLH